MPHLTRRQWLTAAPLLAAAPAVGADRTPPNPLGFSLYGMKALSLADALTACARVGYDGVELALMPGYPAEPKLLGAAARADLRGRLADTRLRVLGLMEHLAEPADDRGHRANLDRLKAAADLGRDLAPDAPPPIESVLGGKPGDWDAVKDRLADRLRAWAAVGREAKTEIAVKPHVGNALHSVDGARWLLKAVDSPWVRLALDHSHFQLRGVQPVDAAAALAPHAAFVHVKDAKGTADKFEFLLPGAGGTDYPAYARALAAAKYGGPVVVEVSGMVSGKPGYDPAMAAAASYAALAPAFGRGD